MTKRGTRAEINTFVQGIITEASPLNFPPNASKDEENFELNTDGSRDRRLGMDYESGYALITTDVTSSSSVTTGKWLSVNNQSGLDFLVTAFSNRLYFHEDNGNALSGAAYKGTILLPEGQQVASMASIDGRLVVVNDYRDAWAISYNSGNNTFSTTRIQLRVRDIWGVQEWIASYEDNPNYRGDNDVIHRYNLNNQGWAASRLNSAGNLADPVLKFIEVHGGAPSNSDVVWTGMQMKPAAAGVDPQEVFYPSLYSGTIGTTATAAKGYFIISPFTRSESRIGQSGIQTLALDSTTGGPTVVCEFAGRIFYGGMNGYQSGGDSRSPSMMNHILFSQMVKGVASLGKCYQEGDPTSREDSDLVDTDGGIIKIAGAKNILAMKNLESHLIVICTNGVWAITGGGDYGFTATNYKVSKISSFGCVAGKSVVVEGGRIYYWGEDGIYVVDKDQMGDLVVKSITQTTIHSFFNKISSTSKKTVVGEYDPYSRKVRWVYRDTVSGVTSNKELVLDVVLGAFYPNRIGSSDNSSIMLYGPVVCKPFEANSVRPGEYSSVRYLTLKIVNGYWQFTYSQYRDSTFRDWVTSGTPSDAKAFVFTGAVTGGDSSGYKQIPYIVMHFRKTEVFVDGNPTPQRESSCKVRCAWDWSNTIYSNRWSSLFQAYRFRQAMFYTNVAADNDNGYETVVTKSKVRGRGRAFALYMETEPLKDCRILGWSLTLNGNSNV